jgi:myo-inositol-1(or 4)-monophosphatase
MASAHLNTPYRPLFRQELSKLEEMAVALANLAGAEIITALGKMHAIRYKTVSADQSTWRDPVSEIDEHVEKLIRARLKDDFPDHDIIGEEMSETPNTDADFIWAVDPIDGTANFVNGYPLFAASIGLIYKNEPVAGAIWCSTSHTLRSGVYHAHRGGQLKFNSEIMQRMANPLVRRGLAGVPVTPINKFPWALRKSGSAAIECAFTAAGLMQVAQFSSPNIWDVAGGVPLIKAAGGVVYSRCKAGWSNFEKFNVQSPGADNLRRWNKCMIIGQQDAAAQMCKLQ